jgi:hypothetical protein
MVLGCKKGSELCFGSRERLGRVKTRPACWEFLWWDNVPEGRRVRRKAIIGTVLQYPNVEDAWQASNGLRVSINEAREFAASVWEPVEK